MYNRNHRRRKPRTSDYGASWISYSDMMAALLVIFVMVLIYSVYQYYIMIDIKTKEILTKETMLNEQSTTLKEQNSAIENQKLLLSQQADDIKLKEIEIAKSQEQLDAQESLLKEQTAKLNAQQLLLNNKSKEIEDKNISLASAQENLKKAQDELIKKENEYNIANEKLKYQAGQMKAQQSKIDDLIGIKTNIIKDLSQALSTSNLKASVDSNTGDIVLDSAIFFDTGKYTIKASGKKLLEEFLPVYFSVLLQEKYKDHIAEIIIEGHTDTVGNYMSNLELSQERALSVVKTCFTQKNIDKNILETLQKILTAKGKSFSNPILKNDGSIDLEKSRRVEFKFRLKDSEMINEIGKILNNN